MTTTTTLPADYRLKIARDAGRRIVADIEALHAEPLPTPFTADHERERSERRSQLLGRAWGALEELLEELDARDAGDGAR